MVVLILFGFPPRAERRSPRKLLGQLPALLRAAEIQAGNDREKWDVGARGGRLPRWARRTCQRKSQTSYLPRNGDSPKTFWKDRRNVDEQDGCDLAQNQIQNFYLPRGVRTKRKFVSHADMSGEEIFFCRSARWLRLHPHGVCKRG